MNSDYADVRSAVRFQLESLSLPDLRTVQRGVLTCEFFPLQIMYSFLWAEDRGYPNGYPPDDNNMPSQEYSRCEVNSIRGWELDTSSKDVEDETIENIDDNQRKRHLNMRKPGCRGKRRRKEWTDEEDTRLKLLKRRKTYPGRKS